MWRDEAYLLDILLAARKVCEFAAGVTEAEFMQDQMRQLAVVKLLEVVGEAARQITDDVKDGHSEIPWRAMTGLRNRLIHEYFRIDLKTVWHVVQHEIPPLVEQIEPLVPPEDAQPR